MSSPVPASPAAAPASKPMYPLTAATKIMSSVRRSFSPSSQKKRHNPSSSTPHDANPLVMPAPYRQDSKAHVPPSIEQIAMGLHISRTPHLRPMNSPQQSHSLPQSRPTSASSNQQTFPIRSSLKKSSHAPSSSIRHSMTSDLSTTSTSFSTATSNTLPTPRSGRSLSSLRLRVPWRSASTSSRSPLAPAAPARSTNLLQENLRHLPRKKAVRFTGHTPYHEPVE
ncbi:hypothetical protein AX14_008935 [Amanita brunnescens Koide BX004]|nr:hypothetical protein AX14_008935 [Amanita brunnescens Koide BX004]